ncbi:MAG: helix-turn-helix domain-containing protein, partial [Armatimonadetes bacterium]|nr:helix-turn-helix domain-containing protein [Armatimonadota bacterium]
CRPELAPGCARIDSAPRLAADSVSLIEDGALSELNVRQLAARLGVSERHLRRVVRTEFGVSPVELAQTHRLLTAKRLLTDTALPLSEVAFASGFASLRRFNALFAERYRLAPGELRRSRAAAMAPPSLTCDLAYRPPLDWQSLLGWMRRRAIAGVEVVSAARYERTLRHGPHSGWLTVEHLPERHLIRAQLSASLAPALVAITAQIKRAFDVGANPAAISETLGRLAAPHPGLRIPGAFDGFETSVRAILGQQVSVPAASTLMNRTVCAFGTGIETGRAGLEWLTPKADAVAAAPQEQLHALGITPARARCIQSLARAAASGAVDLSPGGDVERKIAGLMQLSGIGAWTANTIAMRVYGWPDAFPHTDLGITKALGTRNPAEVLRTAETWRPWRAYAAMHLWKSQEVVR